ncbi:MAG: hypothetical protein AABW49_03065 [Nanoarchaeota archaeon]
MADVIVTLRVRLENPKIKPEIITKLAKQAIEKLNGKVHETKTEPLAFGIKQLVIILTRDESIGSADDIEEMVGDIAGVQSAEVIGVTRALG